VLELIRYGEVAEDNEEDENIVYRKSLLDEIPREKLESALTPEMKPDPAVKDQCKRNPENREPESIRDTDCVCLTVKSEEVEKQEQGDESKEGSPDSWCSYGSERHWKNLISVSEPNNKSILW